MCFCLSRSEHNSIYNVSHYYILYQVIAPSAGASGDGVTVSGTQTLCYVLSCRCAFVCHDPSTTQSTMYHITYYTSTLPLSRGSRGWGYSYRGSVWSCRCVSVCHDQSITQSTMYHIITYYTRSLPLLQGLQGIGVLSQGFGHFVMCGAVDVFLSVTVRAQLNLQSHYIHVTLHIILAPWPSPGVPGNVTVTGAQTLCYVQSCSCVSVCHDQSIKQSGSLKQEVHNFQLSGLVQGQA